MIKVFELFSISVILFAAGIVHCTTNKDGKASGLETPVTFKKDALTLANQTNLHKASQVKKHKYSSKIAGSRFSTENTFGIRIPSISKSNLVNEIAQTKNKVISTTENVLDFRISNAKKSKTEEKIKERDEKNNKKDMATASAGGGKAKKEADEEEEKTLAQQVADGKYGLIQNEIFANGSKRPGILSYAANTEVPKDTRENLGGLEKDEIWLAEDHILVLRGGNYQNVKENKTSVQVWPPIDNYNAPNRQVKLPKNPDIPPPFPVQLTEDGPIEFLKGQREPSAIPPVIPPLPPFAQESNKSTPFLYPGEGNKTFPFPVPPHLLPPFLSNLPPGATFVAPPVNHTDIDEDDPSIYYPPRYDFYYPLDNVTAVPPGPLVPGIILPPPPDFFALLENDTDASLGQYNETDYNINSVTPNSFMGLKYLPAKKPSRPRVSSNRYLKRPATGHNSTDISNAPESVSKFNKTAVTYVFPENSKQKFPAATTPSQNFHRPRGKVPANKYPSEFTTKIHVPNTQNQSIYHPLPTTSPKPNHITLPTTKTLPKQIYIITTPEAIDKNRIENIYKNAKATEAPKYELISPEIHPLRSLIKPNVTISYNGKYGRLPPATAFPFSKSEDEDTKPIKGFYVTQLPPAKTSKAPSTDINSITVTPIPIVKKIRVHPVPLEKPEIVTPSSNTSKATFYFYEEPPTIESPKLVQKPEIPSERLPVQIATYIPLKNEIKPVTQFYYTTKSTSKTPIRQFLEETFHSSNVLPQKPQIVHINNAEIITPNSYSEIQKMKHLNYGTHVSPKPAIKYQYEVENKAVIIPSPKIKDLEIKNSGTIGLQNVNLDRAAPRPTSKPIVVQDTTGPTQKPEVHNPPAAPIYAEPPKLTAFKDNDGPFIPSNYYATVRPELIHFTSQEQTLVDDITKNYFTIFGQKINSVSTTPLTPVKSTNDKNKNKQESGLTYVSDGGQNFKIQQVHETPATTPGKSSSVFYATEKPKATTPGSPSSNFEKYLKELTGEDQKDYIITGVFPAKIKKGKGFFEAGPPVGGISPQLLSQGPTLFPNGEPPLDQVHSAKSPKEQGTNKPRVPYHPTFSTTLRPINVEIKPQYIHHIPPTSKPIGVYPHILPPNLSINNFQQYLQEITGLTSPTTTRPVRVKNPNVEYFPATPSPLKPLMFQHPPFQVPDVKPKPISLEGDILVNFKRPSPAINPEAELINIRAPGLPFDVSPNIKIVDSPDLSKDPNQPYSTKQITFGVAKDIFENLPKSGYFSPPHQTGGNSFVSYNLPGNGGHFYFLTPQIVQKEAEERRRQDQAQKRTYRHEDRSNGRPRVAKPDVYSSEIKHNSEGFSNQEYLRRNWKSQ